MKVFKNPDTEVTDSSPEREGRRGFDRHDNKEGGRMNSLRTVFPKRSIKSDHDEYVRAWRDAVALDQVKAELERLDRQTVGQGRFHEARRRRAAEKLKALNDRLTPGAKAKAIRWQRAALRIATRHHPTEKAYYYYRIACAVQSQFSSVSIRTVMEFLRRIGFGRRERLRKTLRNS